MIDVGTPPNALIARLKTKIQDIPEFQEWDKFEGFLEEPDLIEALVSALEEYNDIGFQTQYTFSDMSQVRGAYFLNLAEAKAYRMIYVRKLWNTIDYSDSGFQVRESAVLAYYKAMYEDAYKTAYGQVAEAKNVDEINRSFVDGISFEY